MAKHRALTPKEARFVAEFMIDGNQTKAAIRAGFSPTSAKQTGSKLMQRPWVKAALDAKEGRLMAKLDITAERIRTERARIAFCNPKDFFNEDGTLKPIHELSDDAAAAIAGMDIESIGKGKNSITRSSKIKLVSKNEALTALERMEGLYKTDDGESLPLNIHIHLD